MIDANTGAEVVVEKELTVPEVFMPEVAEGNVAQTRVSVPQLSKLGFFI